MSSKIIPGISVHRSIGWNVVKEEKDKRGIHYQILDEGIYYSPWGTFKRGHWIPVSPNKKRQSYKENENGDTGKKHFEASN